MQKIVENESNVMTKCPWSNKGAKLASNEFVNYCEQHGIKRKYAISKTSQQNVVFERKNHTMIEMKRIVLDESKVPNSY